MNWNKWFSVARKMPFYIFLLISNKVYSVRDERPFLCFLIAFCTGVQTSFCQFHVVITIILDIISPEIFILWCKTFFQFLLFWKTCDILHLIRFQHSTLRALCWYRNLPSKEIGQGLEAASYPQGMRLCSSCHCKIQKLSFLGDTFLIM